MMYPDSTPSRAAWLLRSAARHLETIDPAPVMGAAIADATSTSGDAAPLSPQFAESAPGNLSVLVHPGGAARDRVALSTEATRRAVRQHLGREATRWLDGRMEPAQDAREDAYFGLTVDRSGLAEGVVGFDLAGGHLEGLPPRLAALARAAVALVPGARVLSTMIRCGRSTGTQQVTVEPAADLPLAALKPLMDELGLGHQHASLMSAAAFLLGTRFTLPAGSARLTLRPIRSGVELRLDMALEAIPDPPPELLGLVRLWMSERPRSVQGLERWLSAFTVDGFPDAGDVTVLSVWVRPDVPARAALFLRPAALAGAEVRPPAVAPPPPRPTAPASAAAARYSPSPWE
ncbi:MAG: hypothetical protein QM767_29250 [Anaeromyxobacter sp.]